MDTYGEEIFLANVYKRKMPYAHNGVKEKIMTAIIQNIRTRQKLSIKAQMIAALFAIATAVALPQVFHLLGAVTGTGTALGIALLPMHLPVIFVGLIAGTVAGAAAGALSPVASMLISGMPVMARLPLMIAELFAYGLVAGLLRSSRMPTILKVLIAQIAGRIVYLGVTVLAIYAFSRSDLGIASALESFKSGLFGVVLQIALLPLLTYRVENFKE